jgi:serine/threonine protein kinase
MQKLTHGTVIHRGDFTLVKNGQYLYKNQKYPVIIKEISKSMKFCENELRMIQLIQLVDPKSKMHMKLYDAFQNSCGQVLVFEKADMNLLDYYDSIREFSVLSKLSFHMFQIIKNLIRFHKFGIVHGDLKPDNIVCHGKRIVFIDFGFTVIADREQKYHVNNPDKPHIFDKKRISSPGYEHPSISKKHAYNLFAQDIWSVMMTAVSLCSGSWFVKDFADGNPISDNVVPRISSIDGARVISENANASGACYVSDNANAYVNPSGSHSGSSSITERPVISDVAWQTAFLDGSWSDKILKFRPNLQQDANWVLFVAFIDNLVQFSQLDFPCASKELLQDFFLQAWRK